MCNNVTLRELIPHRPPFLLLDKVVSLDREHIRATCRIGENHTLFKQVFKGHYPGNPVTPGVLLCEMVFQAGAVLLASRRDGESRGVPVLVKIADARFKQTIRPGDEVEVSASFEEQVSNAFYMKGMVKKNGKQAVRVGFTCALVPE